MFIMNKVYLLLKRIPRGKVATYGALAKACNTSPRAVGALMRSNRHPETYPCYKIVKSTGDVGGYCGSAQKDMEKKISLLKKDGIAITNGKIDLRKYGHAFR